MRLLDDFVTTKYNIFLFELRKQQKKSAQAGALGSTAAAPPDSSNWWFDPAPYDPNAPTNY